jgi:hypothetical protein
MLCEPGVVVHAYNLSTWEAEEGGFGLAKSRPAWVTLCKYCVHMHVNGKKIAVKTIPGMGEKGKF